jgi:hypothetical protein
LPLPRLSRLYLLLHKHHQANEWDKLRLGSPLFISKII